MTYYKSRRLRCCVCGTRQKSGDTATLLAMERITLMAAGWCRVSVDDPALTIMARLTTTANGRIAIAEIVLARFPGVTADALRAIPIGRLEAWANGPGREDVIAEIERRSLAESENSDLDSRVRSLADTWARWGTSPEALAAEESRMEEVAALGVSEQFNAGEIGIGWGLDGKPVVLRSRIRNLQLRIPEGQPKPDSFYQEVARLFGEIAVNSPRPAAVLAEANDVKPSTVHGWVKEARRRGLLAPGERQARRKP
jgi:hypothetical protein